MLFFSIISTIIDIISSTVMNGCSNWWVYQILMTIYVISMPLLAVVWVGYVYILIAGKAVGKLPVVYGQTSEQVQEKAKRPFWMFWKSNP